MNRVFLSCTLIGVVFGVYFFKNKKIVFGVCFAKSKKKLTGNDKEKETLRDLITTYDNFPTPDVGFKDIFPIFRDPQATKLLISLLSDHIKSLGQIDVIVGLDARGFLIGPMLALMSNCSFVPFRKAGKLPGEVVGVKYFKEYGDDKLQVQAGAIPDGSRVVIVDDLIASGGTMDAACEIVKMCNSKVVECVVIVDLIDLRDRIYFIPLWSLFQF